MKPFLLLHLLMLLCMTTFAQHRIDGHQYATRSEVLARHGMAATSQPLATQVALHILRQGGNAIDAAIAANAMLGLVEPASCGIGGDLFAIVWEAKSGKLWGLNASGRSPQALSREYFVQHNMEYIPYLGPLPVTVPGCVDGWFELQQKFGSMPMRELLQPAINYAEEGFPVSEVIALEMAAGSKARAELPGFAETYLPGGQSPAPGTIFKNPDLAHSYRLIAEGGRDAFYKGKIARSIDAYMKAHGGFLRYEDLATHTSSWVQPISTLYRGYQVWELPPNGQGTAVLQMLNMLEAYDLRSMGFGSAQYLHLLTEVKKLAYEDRARFYADLDMNQLPVEKLISKSYAQQRLKLYDPGQAARQYPAGTADIEEGNTVYLTVADEAGNMVSLIQSIYTGYGSGMVPDGLGFVLQNRGQMFNVKDPGHANALEPGKRPFHTIIPAFVTKDGAPWLSFGVMGGAMQPQGHVQVLVNLIDFGMGLQEAGDAPRMRHTGSSQPVGSIMLDGGVLHLEPGFSEATLRQLRSMGHQVQVEKGIYGGYQAIMFQAKTGVYHGASESRKDGQAAGF